MAKNEQFKSNLDIAETLTFEIVRLLIATGVVLGGLRLASRVGSIVLEKTPSQFQNNILSPRPPFSTSVPVEEK